MSVRIVAGRLRNRRIECPKGQSTRPTLERVREALFSILGDIEGSTVVDFYAGSGALGFEALSRGALRAVLVEADRAAAALLKKNAEALGVSDACRILQMPVEECRRALEPYAPLDLVLADPPWRIAAQALEAVPKAVRGLLSPGGRLVIGHAAKERLEPAPGSGLTLEQCRRWGDSALSFFDSAV